MPKAKLSKHLRQMKFMQKASTRSDEEDEMNADSAATSDHLSKQIKYVFEPSYGAVEQLRFGRVSFKGMNLEIEKFNDDLTGKTNPTRSATSTKPDMDMDVSDQEMANRYRHRHSASDRNGFIKRNK